MNKGLSSLQLRLISSLCMLAMVSLVFAIGPWAISCALCLLAALLTAEWLRIQSGKDAWPWGWSFWLSMHLVIFAMAAAIASYEVLVPFFLLALTVLHWRGFNKKWMLLWPWLFVLASACFWLLYQQQGLMALLWVLVIVWASDIGAFFVGRTFGGPKLLPSVSPNKTWSGAIGGWIAALLLAWIFAYFAGVPSLERLGFSFFPLVLCLSMLSQVGDLLQSYYKRQYGIKDSSQLIPGHGGLFDRVDGLLPTVLVAYLYFLA